MYWIGVEKVLNGKTYAYYLSDGAYIGNGFTSNANPYAHFGYSYQDYLTGYQDSRNCTLAHISWTYDQVRAHANAARQSWFYCRCSALKSGYAAGCSRNRLLPPPAPPAVQGQPQQLSAAAGQHLLLIRSRQEQVGGGCMQGEWRH